MSSRSRYLLFESDERTFLCWWNTLSIATRGKVVRKLRPSTRSGDWSWFHPRHLGFRLSCDVHGLRWCSILRFGLLHNMARHAVDQTLVRTEDVIRCRQIATFPMNRGSGARIRTRLPAHALARWLVALRSSSSARIVTPRLQACTPCTTPSFRTSIISSTVAPALNAFLMWRRVPGP
jgi:hypothetical protein